MENLNAEQIIKALGICWDTTCTDCEFNDTCEGHWQVLENAKTLINSYEQKIKQLTEANETAALAYLELTKENERLLKRNFDLAEKGENVVIAYKKLSDENTQLRSIIDEAKKNAIEHVKMLKEIKSEAKNFKNNILLTLLNELNAELLKVARCQKADEPNMRSQDVFDILDRTVKGTMEDVK